MEWGPWHVCQCLQVRECHLPDGVLHYLLQILRGDATVTCVSSYDILALGGEMDGCVQVCGGSLMNVETEFWPQSFHKRSF